MTHGQSNLAQKVMHVQCSKQWRGVVKLWDVPIRSEVHKASTDYLATLYLLLTAHQFPFMEEPDMTLKKFTRRLSTCRLRLGAPPLGREMRRAHAACQRAPTSIRSSA